MDGVNGGASDFSPGQFGAAAQMHFRVNMVQVHLHGAVGNPQLAADSLVAQPAYDEIGDFGFALGKFESGAGRRFR